MSMHVYPQSTALSQIITQHVTTIASNTLLLYNLIMSLWPNY